MRLSLPLKSKNSDTLGDEMNDKQIIKKLTEELEEATKPKWISVEDKLLKNLALIFVGVRITRIEKCGIIL